MYNLEVLLYVLKTFFYHHVDVYLIQQRSILTLLYRTDHNQFHFNVFRSYKRFIQTYLTKQRQISLDIPSERYGY